MRYHFLLGSNILLWTVVQQQILILEFLQKISACPSTPGPIQEKTLLSDITRYQNQDHTDYILVAKDGETVHNQQKQDWEMTVA